MPQRLRNQQKFLLLKSHFQLPKIILQIGVNPLPNQLLSSNVETCPLDYPMIFQMRFYTDFLRRHHMLEDVAKIRRVVLACGL